LNILLVDPPFQIFMGFHRFYYPLGLGYLAAVLNTHGHNSRIYDGEHSSECKSLTWVEASQNYHLYLEALKDNRRAEWENFSGWLKRVKPQIVGLGVLSVKVPAALKLAALCKEFDKNIIVIAGADHATLAPQELLADENIDFAVRGEGEYTLLELVTYLGEGKGRLEEIKGLSYRKNGGIIHNQPRELIADLDALPFPAIDSLINIEGYRSLDLGVIMASRGCPFSCTYCGVANVLGRGARFRSPENVISEMKLLKQKYAVNYFSFRDGSFTVNRKQVCDLCNLMMAENLNIAWECSTRLDLLDDDLISRMKNAGCAAIRIGIETGNERLMQQMKRKITLDQIREAARMLHRHDLFWTTYFMLGVPGETRDTIEDTLKLIAEIDPPFVTIAKYSLIPGTEMYQEIKEARLISEPVDWALESNQSPMRSYSRHLEHKEFADLMVKAAEIVARHNARHSRLNQKDSRLKM
jgi:anaerobic magnesium-protoporphyrin IX monomethyl ester cyclase